MAKNRSLLKVKTQIYCPNYATQIVCLGFFQGWDDKYDASAVFESMKNAL
jgi:hypothetical protein